MNKAALATMGTPATVTLMAQGLNLVVIADGPFPLEYTATGAARLRTTGLAPRLAFMPGKYALGAGRYTSLVGVVFPAALLREHYGALVSAGRMRHARIRQAKEG